MKIKMQFGAVKTAIIASITGISLVLIVLDALLLGGVFGDTINVPVASVSLGAGVIILVASLSLLLGSQYIVGKEGFKMMFGFFYSVEVFYASVISVKENSTTNQVFVSVQNAKGGISNFALNLTGENADMVAKEIATRSGMLVDYYSP